VAIKDSFYHLHTPKTGGHYLKSKITDMVCPSLEDKNIPFVIDHGGWTHVTDNAFVLSSWRDPAKRTVSHFCHYIKYGVINAESTVAELMSWIDSNRAYLTDYQARSLFYIKNDPEFFYLNDPTFTELRIEYAPLHEKLKRIDVLLKDTQLIKPICNEVVKLIFNSFDILEPISKPITEFHNVNDMSEHLYNKLYKSELTALYELNRIDSDIYFNDSLFWDGGKDDYSDYRVTW
jgi:hypothetical protein